jgi:uncharacterized protein YtpQ (UPF0354 family)
MKNNNAKSSKTTTGGTSLLTPTQFTQEYASGLRTAMPSIKVQIEKDLQLKLTTANGKVGFNFLDNAWNAYLLAPENKEQVMQHTFQAICESSKLLDAPPDKTHILPVLKHKQWLQTIRAHAKASCGVRGVAVVYEPYNDELLIVYAEDTPNDIIYPAPDRLQKLNLSTADLQQLAFRNLRRLMPTPKVQFSDGLLWIRAGGSYDTSLLLLEDFWNETKHDVPGEIVAAIPARDCLVVTGNQDPGRVEVLRRVAQTIEAQAAYPLTSRLFVRRQGRFLPYEPGA